MNPPALSAAGGVVTRATPAGLEILLVHRHRYGDWSLPKGKPEPGESLEQTALREVREETGQDVELLEFLGETHYVVKQVPKVVRFWRMRPVGTSAPIQDRDEVAEAGWFSTTEALARLTYPGEREIVRLLAGC